MTKELLKSVKIASAFLVMLMISVATIAKPISEITAKQAALSFLSGEIFYTPAQPLSLVNASGSLPNDGYYIFSNDNCFVIISADDASNPILAYSTESGFKTNKTSPEVSYMLGNYSKQVKYIVSNQIAATTEISNKWTALLNNAAPAENKNAPYVRNLIKTTWDQAPFYNDMCPFDNSYNQRTVTGCVATAMAQVLKYWNYPTSGLGSNSYNDASYGMLSASFDTTKYAWSAMPTNLITSNTAVATLMYDCGVAVDMNYGVAAVGGSSAYVVPNGGNRNTTEKCAENAFVNYFGYDATTIKGLTRSSFADSTWINMLETELSNGRPVIYSGFDSANEGHCFVFDGYTTQNAHYPNYFHVNWGWSGAFNGYFEISSLNPGTGGIGAGSIGAFNFGQQAIMGIQPPAGALSGIQTITNTAGSIKVYPNPANDHITADLTGINGTAQQINLINIQGKIVNSIIPGNNENNITINTSNIQNGIYVLQILSDKGMVNSKVVINR